MELTPIAVPSVEIRDGVPVTTSLNVAALLRKELRQGHRQKAEYIWETFCVKGGGK